jgi:hypothetical protein
MIRYTVALAGLLTLTASLCALGQDWDQKVSVVSLPKWSYENLISFLGTRAGLVVTIEPDALDAARTARPPYVGFNASFDNVPLRYALSWTLHFANVSAAVTNGTLHVRKHDGTPELPPLLSCYAETNGNWMVSLTNTLPDTVTLRREKWDMYQLLSYLCYKGGIRPYVIDPAIVLQERQIDVTFQATPTLVALDQVLGQIGATRRPQGGVYYIRKKTGDAQSG